MGDFINIKALVFAPRLDGNKANWTVEDWKPLARMATGLDPYYGRWFMDWVRRIPNHTTIVTRVWFRTTKGITGVLLLHLLWLSSTNPSKKCVIKPTLIRTRTRWRPSPLLKNYTDQDRSLHQNVHEKSCNTNIRGRRQLNIRHGSISLQRSSDNLQNQCHVELLHSKHDIILDYIWHVSDMYI